MGWFVFIIGKLFVPRNGEVLLVIEIGFLGGGCDTGGCCAKTFNIVKHARKRIASVTKLADRDFCVLGIKPAPQTYP